MSKMVIKKITIYGFGKWVDTSFECTTPFSCFFGENESGKSTLQQFILFMLFGLSPKERSFYRPKTSGKLGGKLTIHDPDIGEYVIERLDERDNGKATCYVSNGETRDETWLQQQLKGLTAKTYESIYSFSALDLIGLDQMKGEDIGEIILGIGLSGSQNIYRLEKRLDQQIGHLFKPNGKIPIINKQLQHLDELFNSLSEYRRAEASYRQKQNHLTEIQHEMKHLQIKRDQLLEQQSMIQKQKHALSSLNDYHFYQKELKQLPKQMPFPEDGIERLKAIKDKLLPLQSESTVLKEAQKKNEQTYRDLQKQIYDEKIIREAQAIVQQQTLYNDRQQTLQTLLDNIQRHKQNVETQLQNLNIGLSSEEVIELHFPFHVEKLWQTLNNEHQQLTIEKEQLKQTFDSLQQEQHVLQTQLQEIEGKILSFDQVNKLNEKITDFHAYNNLQHMQETKFSQLQAWEKNKSSKVRKMIYILLGSVVGGIFLGLMAFFQEQPGLYHLMILLFMIGFGQWYVGQQSIKQANTMIENNYVTNETLPHVTVGEKTEAEQQLHKNEEYKQQLNGLYDQLRLLEIDMIKWQEKRTLLDQRNRRWNERIRLEQERYPFLKDIEITYWPEIYHTLQRLITHLDEINHNEQQEETLRLAQQTHRQKVKQFCKRVNIFDDKMSLTQMIDAIEAFIEKQKHVQSLNQHYDHVLSETQHNLYQLYTKINTYKQEINHLYKVAKVKTEEEFYQRAAVIEQKQDIIISLTKIEQHLSTIFSNDEWKYLSTKTFNEHSLDLAEDRVVEKLQHIERALDDKRQQLSDVNADILQMESSESYSKSVHQFKMEKEHLQTLAKEWAILKTAQDMLVETKRNYREKYLTEVIDKTTQYFSYMTDGKYTKVFAPSHQKGLQVETFDVTRYNVNELSQGTVDQLYIALRLAISDVMGEKQKLPFIIDDAFIHSDHIRTRRIIDILLTISKRQQIILFTCNEDVLSGLNQQQIIRLDSHIYTNE